MASPVVSLQDFNTSAGTQTIDLSAADLSAGVIIGLHAGQNTVTDLTVADADYTALSAGNFGGGGGFRFWYAINPSATSVVVTLVSASSKATGFVITDADMSSDQAPDIADTTGTTNPDPPSNSWAWGDVSTRSIAVCGKRKGSLGEPTAGPSGYSDFTSSSNSTSANADSAGGIAWKNVSTSPEDPGSFTASDTGTSVAGTIVYELAAGGGGSTTLKRNRAATVGAGR